MLSVSNSFLHFLHPVYLWLETTFGTVQKWSLRPLLDSPKGSLNIGILLYILFVLQWLFIWLYFPSCIDYLFVCVAFMCWCMYTCVSIFSWLPSCCICYIFSVFFMWVHTFSVLTFVVYLSRFFSVALLCICIYFQYYFSCVYLELHSFCVCIYFQLSLDFCFKIHRVWCQEITQTVQACSEEEGWRTRKRRGM